ncbi:MAG TPA: nodulation protein NfeD [Anaerolineales bacterium]|nr:nodulation protein NfeD [Anaerolineales bacterium]
MNTLIKTLIFTGICLSIWAAAPAYAQEASPAILVIEADGVVAPAMREYIRRGLATAEQRGVSVVVLRLDTPGGAVDSMTEIVAAIRGSPIPVAVYVAPSGSMAASAGTVITLAGHVAAMAPETVIGAASPVGGQGEDLGETIETKVKEALRAQVRSLMEGRSAEAIALAEETIENAIAVTATEALAAGMIDIIAVDLSDLLRQLDGRTVRFPDGSTEILSTAFAEVQTLPPSLIEQLLAILTDPNIVFLLLTIGVQAVLIELGSPGGWVAGFVGFASLTLAAFGLGFLETNLLGLAFLVMSFVLFVLEIKTPTQGALTAAGVVSFIVGALVLFNSPGTPGFARVSVPLVVASGVAMGLIFGAVVAFAIRAQRGRPRTGQEGLVGRTGRAQTALAPAGLVQVGGEQWSAVAEVGTIEAGRRVEVVSVQGVRLTVRETD